MIYVIDHKHPHVNDLPAYGATRVLTDEESQQIWNHAASIADLVPNHWDIEFVVYRHPKGELRLLKSADRWPAGTPVRG